MAALTLGSGVFSFMIERCANLWIYPETLPYRQATFIEPRQAAFVGSDTNTR
jgi:hypothetical protein